MTGKRPPPPTECETGGMKQLWRDPAAQKRSWTHVTPKPITAFIATRHPLFLFRPKLNHRLKNLNSFTSIHLKKSLKPPKIQEFINQNTKVYASIININGDVTSPYQFYATDSVNNLIIGILSLKSKTKYDSVLPALDYLRNDIYHLIESIKWSANK